MFGTLYVPAKTREALTFGFPGDPDAHTVKGELINPLINATGHLKPLWPKKAETPLPAASRDPA